MKACFQLDLVFPVVSLQFSISVVLKVCECFRVNVGVTVGVQKSTWSRPHHQVGRLGRWLPHSAFPSQHTLDLGPEQLQELGVVTPGWSSDVEAGLRPGTFCRPRPPWSQQKAVSCSLASEFSLHWGALELMAWKMSSVRHSFYHHTQAAGGSRARGHYSSGTEVGPPGNGLHELSQVTYFLIYNGGVIPTSTEYSPQRLVETREFRTHQRSFSDW